MPAKTFTKTVAIPKRNTDGTLLTENGTPEGTPLVEREVGVFTFRVPTFREQTDIDVRTWKHFSQLNLQSIPTHVFTRVMACSCFPYQVEDSPKAWDWERMTLEEAEAIYAAYVEGEAEVNGTKNS